MLYRFSLLVLCLGVVGCSGIVEKPEVAEPPVVVPDPVPEPPPEPEPMDLRPEWPDGTVIQVAPLVALEPMDQVVLPEVAGGDEPITYSLLSLPDRLGLEFDPAERLLTGTPSHAGSHNLTYRAEDADGDQAQLTFTLEVLDPLPVTVVHISSDAPAHDAVRVTWRVENPHQDHEVELEFHGEPVPADQWSTETVDGVVWMLYRATDLEPETEYCAAVSVFADSLRGNAAEQSCVTTPPAPVEVSLHIERADESASRRLRAASAGDAGLHPSVNTLQEGQSFRLFVRFSGTTPIDGTCTITLVDSGGHDMDDATATADGFDANTDLIATVDDDEVTTDRTITATLSACDLQVAHTIGEPNSVTITVRDHDPDEGTQFVPGGTPVGVPAPPQNPTQPQTPVWVPGSYTASISSFTVVHKQWGDQNQYENYVPTVTVSISPSLPSLPSEVNGSYSVGLSATVIYPDGRKSYPTARVSLRSGSSASAEFWIEKMLGTQVQVTLDSFSEIVFIGGNNQYADVSRYGYYSIGSPSSASVTVTF